MRHDILRRENDPSAPTTGSRPGRAAGAGRALAWSVAASFAALAAASAEAQDYTVTETSGLYDPIPSTVTTLQFPATKLGKDDGFATTLTKLPFPFTYYGFTYQKINVCTNGFALFNPVGPSHPHGQNTALNIGTAFRYTDGIAAPLWDDLDFTNQGSVMTWMSGTAPNRKFVVCWDHAQEWQPASGSNTNPTTYPASTCDCTFELQLFETSGRIVFAYDTGGVWPNLDWNGVRGATGLIVLTAGGQTSIGIDAVTLPETNQDARYLEPTGTNNPLNDGRPAYDYQFDPVVRTYTGRLLYDRVVVDASGIGNSVESNVPLAGVNVELRYGAAVPDSATTDADGYFTMVTKALDGTVTDASFVVTARDPAYVVTNLTGGSPYELTIASSVSLAAGRDFGTITLGDGNDPGATLREALTIASAVHDVYAWSSARTTDPIPLLEILFDSAAGTVYTAARTGAVEVPAQMHVSGAASNPDAWDRAIVRKTYARHILASIAGPATTQDDARFDAVSDEENAFAEGFGYYMNSVITNTHQVIDGVSSSSAIVYELEDPVATSPKRDTVAAWMAACLYDLTDAANEPWDKVDGTGALGDRPFLVVDSLTGAVTGPRFAQAWYDAGYATTASSDLFIHYGLAPDDADEPNDAAAGATVLTQFGFKRVHRVLNLRNEDWLRFALPDAANSLVVDVAYDRSVTGAAASLEVQNLAGVVLARGALVGAIGPLHAVTGPLPAGTYRTRIVNSGSVAVADYTVQAYLPLTISGSALPAWTVRRPYDVSVPVTGGVAPHELTVGGNTFLDPPGLFLDGPKDRVHGTPQNIGTFSFVMTADDDGGPKNSTSALQSLVINPELLLEVGEFLAFAQGKPLAGRCPFTGGTAPYTLNVAAGALPAGVLVAPGDLCFTGAAALPGSSPLLLDGIDVAGSTSTVQTLGVVCVAFGFTPLQSDAAACGFWFDAVQGSAASVAVSTVRKQPKRALRLVVTGPDGTTEIAAVVKSGVGKASLSRFIAPVSGRFYCVIASDAGAATQLAAKGRVAAPKSGAGVNGTETFVSGDELAVEIGALAGAKLTFAAKPDKSGLQMTAVRLTDPTGASLPLDAGDVVEKKGTITIKKTLAISGTWTLVLGAKPGPQGHFKYKYQVKEPKKVVYSAD